MVKCGKYIWIFQSHRSSGNSTVSPKKTKEHATVRRGMRIQLNLNLHGGGDSKFWTLSQHKKTIFASPTWIIWSFLEGKNSQSTPRSKSGGSIQACRAVFSHLDDLHLDQNEEIVLNHLPNVNNLQPSYCVTWFCPEKKKKHGKIESSKVWRFEKKTHNPDVFLSLLQASPWMIPRLVNQKTSP